MTPLRVLMVSDVSPLTAEGGGERVLWEHASGLARRGHRVTVVGRAPDGAPAGDSERDGVRVVLFAAPRASTLRFARDAIFAARRAVAGVLARETVDVLDVFQPLSGYGALGLPAARRLPALYTFLSPAPLEYRSRARMTRHHLGGLPGRLGALALWAVERAALRRATRIQVLSEYSAQQLWQLYGFTADRIVKIPGAADVRRFHPAADREAVRARLGLPKEAPLLLTVRNLELRMGLDTLLHAMARVASRRPDARLLIGGAGSLRADLERLARTLGLERQVAFLGFIPDGDLPLYYQAADCFVLPTRELEGFGLVTVEALACGTPVLGTAVGATPELLDPIDPALVFSAATPEAMADSLLAFLARVEADPAAILRLRAAARAHAERNYDWERVGATLERELRALAAGEARRPAPAACEACDGPLGAAGLVYRGQPYRRCARCGARASVSMPSADALRRCYETTYPRSFAPRCIRPTRRRVLTTILARARGDAAGGRLLDVGCGGGHLLTALGGGWRGIGTDLSHAACAAARAATGAPVAQADAAALPFRDGSLDVVTLINVLDHTAAARATLQEAARVLRPGGLLAVRVPNGPVHATAARALAALGPLARLRGWDAFPVLHVFSFGRRSLERLLARAGFDVLRVVNSDLAWAPSGAAGRLLEVAVRATAGAAAVVSRGRWLVGPSLEVYAYRR
ncbi:MAG TPA: glycosyltransferase [Methylomirabilota bacterium]|nr:glycosyltransferase [Methylomirabilota bacterium]